ncbi:alpha-2-macroglobulin-like isoform X2 [Dreissena polymorpha]|uniref:alpha-2-macroglobulin-like isoform X2 n=1 Tax=Dreissena polymorpha TaxID=45954 RepID=UPI00226542BB|nr:alpha-2-macroglobulin-like isoform X2 [Dreissena polymorpha]
MRFLGQFLISLGLCSLASAQRYFATIPKEVRNGMYYKVDVTLLRSSNAATYFDVSIWTSDNSSKLWTDPKSSEFTIKIDAGKTSGSDQIMVPYAVPANMECSVRIESRGMNPEISEQQTVKVIRPVPAIFIQTDKKIFKPSQEIRFRVLNTDEHLKPKSETLDVEIKDSKENVIFKKSSPDTNSNGMVEGHFKLSDDPILGTYKIIASTETGYTQETFRVEEYKLPKFEVTATCDPCYAVYNPDLQLTGSVSSMYTFGKQVQGRLSIKVFGTSLNAVEVVKVDDFDGSYDFDFGLYETIVMPYYSAKGIDFFQPYTAYNSITVIASVYEAYTEIEANTTLTYKVFPTSFKATEVLPLPFLFDGATEYSFEVKLTDPMENQLKTSDGQQITDFSAYKLYYSVNGSPLQANVTGYQQKLTVTEKYFSNIQVWYTKGKEESIKASLNPTKYYSGSKTGLTIALVTSQNQTERCFKVEPFKTGDTVYFQVVNNYYSEEIKPYTNTNGHCFNVSSQHAPASLVLAYKTMPYMVDEIQYTEMLVASIVVEIPWSSNHQVSMTTADKSVKPGADVTVLFNTEPNSYVYVAGLDKSVALLAGSNDVTRQKLQDAVEQYRPFSRSKENPFPNPPWIRGGFMPLEAVARRKKRCIIGCGWHDHADGVNPTKVLEEAGLIMVTDLTLFKKLVEMTPEMAFDGRFQLAADSSDSNNKVPAEVKSSKPESEAEKEPEPRKNFLETWLWNMVQTNNTGAAMLSANAPDTITSWLLNAYAFNAQVGLGVAPTVEVQVFQEFFMSMNLPYSIVRGEIFTLQILVFNYKDNDLDVLVTLNKANLDYSVLGPAQKQVKIPRQASRVAEFNVTVSVKVGTVLLLATAKDRTNSAVTDSVERELLVKPEGREVVRSTNLKMKIGETSEEYLNLTKLFDPEDMEDFVSGSLRMYLKVTGDMMGPVIENLEGNIRMPVGCGEQNIQTLTPGLFAGKYLKAINRLDSDAEKKIQEVCGYGYRKELIYKHADGSFSAFGEGPGLCSMCEGGQPEQPPKTYGSTWLTAYVLKMFSILKNEGFTYVSPEILYEMFNYLKGVKRPGCEDQFFVEQGDLIHKEMMGGSDSRIGFTAFCIAAILDYKSTLVLTDLTEKMAEVETVLNAAMTWMKNKISVLKSSQNAYQATVVAYTLAKSSASPSDANYKAARDLLDAVDSWAGTPEPADSPSECIADKTVVDACPSEGL